MIISFPLNRASTRSMFKMQLLQPEVQKLRAKYKPSRDSTVQERQEMRQKLNEEMMALYRENNVSMAGGCLPNLVIFPIFIVLYDVIRGLTNTCAAVSAHATTCATAAQLKGVAHPVALWAPRYIISGTRMYHNLKAANGKMISFGINLASSVRTPQPKWIDILPFVGVVLIAIALQYVQLKQMTGRNTQTGQVAQQMQAMQKFMPLVMALIYVNIPAAVNVYFIFSSLFRIGQQEWMYRRDPQIVHAMEQLKARKANAAAGEKGGAGAGARRKADALEPAGPPPPGGLRGFRARLAQALAPDMALDGDGSPGAGGGQRAGAGGRGNGTVSRGTGGSGKTGAGARPGAGASRTGSAGTGGGRASGSGAAKGGTARGTAGGNAKASGTGGTARTAGAGGAGGAKPGAGKPAAAKPAAAKPAAAKPGSGKARPGGGPGAEPSGNGSNPDVPSDAASTDPSAPGKRPRRPR
jgi:YidC/Oxa1 family membrane protein insertase